MATQEDRIKAMIDLVADDISSLESSGGVTGDKPSDLNPLTGANVAAADLFVINDTSAVETKTITASELLAFVEANGHPKRHFIRADVDRTLPNDLNLNALFNSPANGRLTLPVGVYTFEGLFIISGMSATSGNALINLLGAGTATVGSWMWYLSGVDNSTPATISADLTPYFQTNATAASAVTAGTGTAMRFHVRGSFEVTAPGTFIPSIDLVTAAAAVVQDGSFFMVERLGDNGLVSFGDWD